MALPTIDQEYFVDFLVKLLNIPSPTGFAEPAISFVEKEFSQYNNWNYQELAKARWLPNGK